MAYNLAPLLRQRFFDANGAPLAGGLLYSYVAGTTTPLTTCSDPNGTSNANPTTLDANGYADIWIDQTLAYKFVLKDSGGATLWTVDNISYPLNIAVWNASIFYQLGNIVQDLSGKGLLYVSITNGNQNNALSSVANWRALGGNITSISTNTNLSVNDELVRSNSTSGSITHTLPACSTTAIGKKITIIDVGTGGNTTTLKGSGSDVVGDLNTYGTTLILNQSVTVENTGTKWDPLGIMSDGAVSTQKIATGAVTQAKLAARAGGSIVAAGGLAISASSGAFVGGAGSENDVTNLMVTITTTGRPVQLVLQPDTSASVCNVLAITNATGSLYFFRGASKLSNAQFNAPSTGNQIIAPGMFSLIDAPTAGTYTYKVRYINSTANIQVNYCVLVAYEL